VLAEAGLVLVVGQNTLARVLGADLSQTFGQIFF
jgi:hypothetical protein